MSDFIDRAKLEAAMLQVDVAHFASKKPLPTVEDYATAVLALLEPEAREERASRIETLPGGGTGTVWYARKVLHGPWVRTEFGNSPRLPSEGGEKRG